MKSFDEIIKEIPNIKILYVEDEIFTLKANSILLKQIFKNITTCSNGEEALEIFKKQNFHIIITDINMPKMNGFEFTKKIREIDNRVSIIFNSAHHDLDHLYEAINLGVDGFLLKPLDIKQLKSVMQRVLLKYLCMANKNELEHYLKQFQNAVNESAIISKTDKKGIITYANENFVKISKYSKDELIGSSHNITRHPDMPKEEFKKLWETIKNKKTFKGLIKNKDKNGGSYYVKTIITPITDLNGNVIEYLAIREDITKYMNPKKMFFDALKARDDILVYMKLKNYETIEEFYPQDILEEIEKKSFNYIYQIFKKSFDIKEAYPLNDGELAVFIDKKFLNSNFTTQLQQIQQKIKEHILNITENIEYDISVFMSVVCEGENVYESAKLGLKDIISANKDFIIANNLAKIHFEKAKENIKTIHLIKKAITNLKIINYFQGIVNNKTNKIEKYESLVRLIDDNGKVLSPFFFLDAAKKSNYYHHITKIVLNNSFDTLNKIKEDISINISFLDIEIDAIRHKIYNLLKTNKQNAHRIVFELLEDETTQNLDLIKEFITEIKKYGVKIAIDDFGSGYSNYTRLLDFQPDILKIDGSLIKNIETDEFSKSIVKSIVTFAKEQNLQTVAEFVENEAIANIIKEYEIDYSQGYYYSKPNPIK